MFGLDELKQTKVFQEAYQLARQEIYQEAKLEVKLEAKLKIIPELFEEGLDFEQIARVLKLPIEVVQQEVQKIQESERNQAMIEIDELKKTKVYQEVYQLAYQEAKLEPIPRMIQFGLSVAEIAQLLDLPIEIVQQEVQKIQEEVMPTALSNDIFNSPKTQPMV